MVGVDSRGSEGRCSGGRAAAERFSWAACTAWATRAEAMQTGAAGLFQGWRALYAVARGPARGRCRLHSIAACSRASARPTAPRGIARAQAACTPRCTRPGSVGAHIAVAAPRCVALSGPTASAVASECSQQRQRCGGGRATAQRAGDGEADPKGPTLEREWRKPEVCSGSGSGSGRMGLTRVPRAAQGHGRAPPRRGWPTRTRAQLDRRTRKRRHVCHGTFGRAAPNGIGR